MKYIFMLVVAFILAITSSILTALGMADLFQGLFVIFLVIDLGRFFLLNFIIDEWKNLRLVKWFSTFILALLFIYSGIGIYNKLTLMIPESIQIAMVEAAGYNNEVQNATTKQNRSEDFINIAKQEYDNALAWNKLDHENCLARAKSTKNVAEAENNCNNLKRRLDKRAYDTYKLAINEANSNLEVTQTAIEKNAKNQSEITGVLTTICKLTGGNCHTYSGLQNALSIIVLLVIIGLDYLQLAIVLAVNTRKNKKITITSTNSNIVTPILSNNLKKPTKNKKVLSKKQKEETVENIKENNNISTVVKKIIKKPKKHFEKESDFYK